MDGCHSCRRYVVVVVVVVVVAAVVDVAADALYLGLIHVGGGQ